VHPHPFDLDGVLVDRGRRTDATVCDRLAVAGGEDVRRPRPRRCCRQTFDPVTTREPLVDLGEIAAQRVLGIGIVDRDLPQARTRRSAAARASVRRSR
jgi:hypothetical protein